MDGFLENQTLALLDSMSMIALCLETTGRILETNSWQILAWIVKMTWIYCIVQIRAYGGLRLDKTFYETESCAVVVLVYPTMGRSPLARR